MVVALTYWMEVALWVVLGSLAADMLVGLFKSLQGNGLSPDPVLNRLKDVVFYVLPLLMLAGFSTMDETGWILKVAYYLSAVAIVIKYLSNIKSKL